MAENAAGNTERRGEAVDRYVERLGLVLNQIGLPRMAGRVFATLMVAGTDPLTAGELASRLGVSPAAISGAVRYLEQVGMVGRQRVPGERRDRYAVLDLWFATAVKRDRLMTMWRDATDDGIDAVGAGTPAGARLAEMRDFLDFALDETRDLFERWHAMRRSRGQ